MNSVMKAHLFKALVIFAAASPALLLVYWARSSDQSPRVLPAHPTMSAQGLPTDPKSVTEHQIKALNKALSEKPGHTPVLLQLARLESGQGKLSDASRHLHEILVREPDSPEVRLELGKVLYQQGDIRGALEQTQEILKKHPTNSDALYNLGAMYGNLGNTERAAEYWRLLIALDPNSESGKLAQQMLPLLDTKDP